MLDETPTEQEHEAKLFERKPRSRYGIKALGSAADGLFSIFFGEQKISEPTEKRAQQVTRLCEELQQMLTVGFGKEPTSRGVTAADQVGGWQAGRRRECAPMERALRCGGQMRKRRDQHSSKPCWTDYPQRCGDGSGTARTAVRHRAEIAHYVARTPATTKLVNDGTGERANFLSTWPWRRWQVKD